MIRRLAATLVLLAGVAVAAPTAAQADHGGPYVPHQNYMGTRWYSMERLTCVEDHMNVVHAAGKSKYVAAAIAEINTKTAAQVIYRYGVGSCGTIAPAQRIYLVDNYYGRTGWWGLVDGGPSCSTVTRTYRCTVWGRTPAGHWTWFYSRQIVIPLNLTYGIPTSAHWALHEIGIHAMMAIKDRPTWSTGNITCYSVAAYCWPGNSWTWFVHPETDIAWYDYIRKQ